MLTTFDEGNHAVSGERWRYIRYRDGAEELYDLQVDPHEWRNLASSAAHAEVKKQMMRAVPRQAGARHEPGGLGRARRD